MQVKCGHAFEILVLTINPEMYQQKNNDPNQQKSASDMTEKQSFCFYFINNNNEYNYFKSAFIKSVLKQLHVAPNKIASLSFLISH